MNKIVEEAMTNMIRRIEALEDKISRISIPNKQGYYEPTKQFTSDQATINQKSYIVKLGGVAPINMTKQEAGKEIDRLLKEKVTDSHPESEVTEPKEVDTDDAGIEGDLM